jgi:hypothetical protein
VQTQCTPVSSRRPLQLHRRLHLHVVPEEAAAEQGLVVGLPRLGRARSHGLDFTEERRAAAAPAQPDGLCPVTVHVVRVQVRVEGPNDGPERVADPVAQVPTILGPESEAARRPAPCGGLPPSHVVVSKVGPGLTALRE